VKVLPDFQHGGILSVDDNAHRRALVPQDGLFGARNWKRNRNYPLNQ